MSRKQQNKSDLSIDTRQGRCYNFICIRSIRMMSLGHMIILTKKAFLLNLCKATHTCFCIQVIIWLIFS